MKRFYKAICPECQHEHDLRYLKNTSHKSATMVCFCGAVLELAPKLLVGWSFPSISVRSKRKR